MNAATAFSRISSLWPQCVNLSVAETNTSGELWFPELARVNQDVESRIDFSSDHWESLGAWSLYQSLVEVSRENYKRGEFVIFPTQIPLAIFDKWIRENLNQEDFEEERLQYRGL